MPTIKRKCDVETLADFSRYYQGGWVGWHDDGTDTVVPCLVNRLLTETDIQLRKLQKEEAGLYLGTSFAATLDTLKEKIDFGIPDIGMVPDGPTVAFVSYSTPRAAKKGYRSRDLKAHNFNSWEIRGKYRQKYSADRYDWTWHAFNPEYKTLEHAEKELGEGISVGLPLSRFLAVYTMPNFKHSCLAYKRWTVGYVLNPQTVYLKREYSDYEQIIARQTDAQVIVG